MHYRVISASLALFTATAADAQEISVLGGGSYSSGRYGGDDKVELGTSYIGVTSTISDWRVDATLPYLMLSSGGSAVDIGGLVLPSEAQNERGFGDAIFRVTTPPLKLRLFTVGLAGQVKLPTGKKSLSTGKVDAAADIEFSRDVGAYSPFLSIGYRIYGDSGDFKLEDGWAASAGSSLTMGRTTFVASYDWSQSAVGTVDSHELFAIAAGPLARRWGWNVYASKGLGSGAADYMFGAGLIRTFGRSDNTLASKRGRR